MSTYKKLNRRGIHTALAALSVMASQPVWAEALNTQLPKQQEETFSVPVNVDIPAQPLANSLHDLGKAAGMSISFPNDLVSGKRAPEVRGRMSRNEALRRLLDGSGLQAKIEGTTVFIQPAPKSGIEKREAKSSLDLDKVEVRAKKFYEVGPMPGLALTKEEIPGNVQSLTAKDIKEAHTLTITDLMNQKLQSVTVNDYQSNPFQMDLQYRGFTASPQLGTAQGISVFLDGIRVNEPFGDVVNWDMIPMNALSSLEMIPGSNPIYGLGTLGGALSMRTKSGFDGKSLDAEVLTGSFGRKQLQISAGNNNGVVAGFLSGNFFLEDGWRDNSPSKVNQIFGKAEWQNERARLSFSGLYAGNKLTGNGLLPQQMVDQNPQQVYTSPDESRNNLFQFQLSGIWDVTDTFNITGQIYKRNSKRKTKTSDINENFGGTDARPNRATPLINPNQQYLYGFQDENRDGKPDYNDFAMNVAADANGNPLTNSGAICAPVDFTDPCLNDLAIGTVFAPRDANGNLQPIVANQGTSAAADGSGSTVLNWTLNPGVNLEPDPIGLPATTNGVFNEPIASAQFNQVVNFALANYGLLLATGGASQLSQILQNLAPHPGTGAQIYNYDIFTAMGTNGVQGGYTDDAGFYHFYNELPPINTANVPPGSLDNVGGIGSGNYGPVIRAPNGQAIPRDGRYGADGSVLPNTGYIEGTPTALITDTQIDQKGIGGALQLNWNLEKHKFMVGASIDKSDSIYDSKQYLGLLDANRRAFVAPELLGWEYYANSPATGVGLNDFSGNSMTKSIYASETWTPIKNLSITAAARFNHNAVNNKLAVNALTSFSDVNSILNFLNLAQLCTGDDTNNDGILDSNIECPTGLAGAIVPFNPIVLPQTAQGQNIGDWRPPETDKFKYRSFNPSLGATWQATEDLNVYGSVGRGARTPTVIELGCAFDPRPLPGSTIPRSIEEQRTCTLPGAMSGDPYLKQVRSTSYEVGARGRLTDNIEWNAAVYRSDLTDDIYFVSVNATDSFFQNIGDTRRQGLEMGIKGSYGKASFGLNYALTDATFQSNIKLASPNNSSAGNVYDLVNGLDGNYQQIFVKPGNRMPGIPLHNLNANFRYEITPNWIVGLNMVMHSKSFIRGNENNQHRAGAASPIDLCLITPPGRPCIIDRAGFGPGETAGYTVFNFQTSYKITPEWTLGLRINNLFDKEYASAGRLGLNAFSPSIRGVIGESGFNYNSADWQGASFLGIGAPRSAFITLSYEFQPDKK